MIRRLPPALLFVVGAVSLYLAAAVAVDLFTRIPPGAVAWLRLCGAAVVLLAIRRPWRRLGEWSADRRRSVFVFGLALGVMNTTYYLAISSLPLGTATAAEFIGPITVAALGTRSLRNGVALALAAVGVVLLADASLDGSPAGFGWILAAATAWGLYIVWGGRSAGAGSDLGDALDGLAAALGIASVVLAPFLLPSVVAAGPGPTDLAAAMVLGVFANVVPYGLDQIVLRRVPRARFALMLAILPATATVVGLVVLAQRPTLTDLAGMAAVVGAILLQSVPVDGEAGGTPPPENTPVL